jgi:hypothetical protein
MGTKAVLSFSSRIASKRCSLSLSVANFQSHLIVNIGSSDELAQMCLDLANRSCDTT